MINLNDNIATIMTTELVTVSENTSLKEIKPLFKSRGIHHLLVEDKKGKFLGIISTEDVHRVVYSSLFDEKMEAGHLITKAPFTIQFDHPIKEAVEQFLDNYYRAIPVTFPGGELAGIITPYDILWKLKE